MLRRLITPERVLTVAVLIIIAAAVSFVAILLLVPNTQEPSLGTYETPHRIASAGRNEVTMHPVVPLGDIVIVSGRRCINSKSVVSILTYRTFTRIDVPPDKPQVVPASVRVREDRSDGVRCRETVLMIAMPIGMVPGIWRLDGVDFSTKDGALRVWSSEDFEIVEAR